MDRRTQLSRRLVVGTILAISAVSAGCAAPLATAMWIWGGNPTPAEFAGLEEKTVAVVCVSAPGGGYQSLLASRELAKRVSRMLEMNVKKINVIPPDKISERADEWGQEDPLSAARALQADVLVAIDLESFSLYAGPTLYRGRANVFVHVHDLKKGDQTIWEKSPNELIYPPNVDVPRSDRQESQFFRDFVDDMSFQIARLFFPWEAEAVFASDARSIH